MENLPFSAEDGPEAVPQALVAVRVAAAPLDLEPKRNKQVLVKILPSFEAAPT